MKKLLTRQELYDLVWAEPTSVVAEALEMSDVMLAKICRSANIPISDRGYWAKKRAGKPTLKPRLPPRGLGQFDQVEVGRGYQLGRPSDSEVLERPLPPPPVFEGDERDLRTRIEAFVQKVPVAKSLAGCHHAISKLLLNDEARRAKLLQSPYSTWHAPYFDSRIEKRRLRILSALFLWAARNDFGCRTDDKRARCAAIIVGDRAVSFSLDAVGSKVDHVHDSKPPIADDAKLALRIDCWQPPPEVRLEWQDTTDRFLEDQLVEIAREIVFAGEWGYRAWAKQSHEMLVERRAELEAAARARHAEEVRKEEARLDGLLAERRHGLWREAAAWRKAENLRAYAEAVLAKRPEEAAWAHWALAEADLIDPLVGRGDN